MQYQKTNGKTGVKCIAFLLTGVVLFGFFQNLLVGKWGWPQYQEQITAPLKNILTTSEPNDVLFLGTSHVLFGVMPMQIYEEQGIVSSNLGTSNQPVAVSYYLLKEILKRQTPQIVMLDASGLFSPGTNDPAWRYVLDTLPLSINKIEMAQTYAAYTEAEGEKYEHLISALFPLYEYHTRWAELNENDFAWLLPTRDTYYQVYNIYTTVSPSKNDNKSMNELAEKLLQDNKMILKGFNADGFYDTTAESVRYEYSIPEDNRIWLEKLLSLCEENGITLVLFKVPAVGDPNEYNSSWTEQRSSQARMIANKYGIPFLDLLYDTDLGIDWSKDSMDGGKHLNWNGAQKVTSYIGNWLKNTYSLQAHTSDLYEKNLEIYKAVGKVAQLQIETEFADYISYLENLSQSLDLAVFFSCSEDMVSGLSEEDIAALHNLGLRTYFEGMEPGEAFFAILDHNTVVHEAESNRRISFWYDLEDGKEIEILTEGEQGEARAYIKFDEVNRAMNTSGLNIVVYDNESHQILDSVAFDLSENAEEGVSRAWWSVDGYLKKYEAWLVKKI